MQWPLLTLTLGIIVCTRASGCAQTASSEDKTHEAGVPKSSAGGAAPLDRWNQYVYRHWAPSLFFDDPKVVQLCKAIAERNHEQIDQLIKIDGVAINAKGRMNMTPLLWAFPLGFVDAFEKIPRDANNRLVESEIVPTQREYLDKHARLLEHLLKLGADPNIKVSQFRQGGRKSVNVPMNLFQLCEGLAVTHLAAKLYMKAKYDFFPLVMANGGDPNLVCDASYGATPIFFVCASGTYFPSTGGSAHRKHLPQNLAYLVGAGVNIEFRDLKGNTPILAAAAVDNYTFVYMLVHAGADFRATNDRGRDLVWLVRERKRFIENMPGEYREFFEKHPDFDIVEGTPREIDPYFLEVVGFLEEDGMLPDGTHAEWKREIDQLIEEYGKAAYGKRDPFVDEWVAKRQKSQEAPGADETTGAKTPD